MMPTAAGDGVAQIGVVQARCGSGRAVSGRSSHMMPSMLNIYAQMLSSCFHIDTCMYPAGYTEDAHA